MGKFFKGTDEKQKWKTQAGTADAVNKLGGLLFKFAKRRISDTLKTQIDRHFHFKLIGSEQLDAAQSAVTPRASRNVTEKSKDPLKEFPTLHTFMRGLKMKAVVPDSSVITELNEQVAEKQSALDGVRQCLVKFEEL